MVIKLKKKMFPSLLSPGKEITVRVYAAHKINKNRNPHTTGIDSFVISRVAIMPEFRKDILQHLFEKMQSE